MESHLPTASMTSERRNNFDLMRLVFALLVILSHSYLLIDGNYNRDPLVYFLHGITIGDLAVNGFFLLSGYLIVQSWQATPKPITFLKKRVLRIYPAFIVAALISALVVGPLGTDGARYFSELYLPRLAKSILLLKVPSVPPTFLGHPFEIVNGPMWTITFEFQCYMAVLMLGVIGALKSRRVWLTITVLILSLGAVQKLIPDVLDLGFLVPVLRFASFFFVGGCFYLYREKIRFDPRIALLCGLLLPVGLAYQDMPETLLALAGGYLLFYAAFSRSPILARINKYPDVSYGVYLYGWPAQKLLVWYVPLLTPRTLFPLACLTALACGLLSWYAIEKPFMKLKSRSWRWKKGGVAAG